MSNYEDGVTAAIDGDFRAAPKSLKILTDGWRQWYKGFDAATATGNNAVLNNKFAIR